VKSRDTIYGLDFIRFFAAAAVVAWHLGYRFFDSGARHIRRFVDGVPADASYLDGITRFGWIGVEVFFVISGLVIAFSALRSDPWRFFVSRLGRLWPGVFVVTVMILAINCLFWGWSLASQIGSAIVTLTFLPRPTWLMPQFWTLWVEVVFYALVWLLIAFKRVHRLDGLALFLLVTSAIYWTTVSIGLHEPDGRIDSMFLVEHGFYFAMGIALCSLDRAGFGWNRVAILAGGVVLAGIEIRFATQMYGVVIDPSDWLQPFAFWLFCVALIAGSLRYKRAIAAVFTPRPWLTRISMSLGLATYPLYLCHIHLGGLLTTLAVKFGMRAAPAIALAALLCVPISMVIARCLEPPIRRLLETTLERLRLRFIARARQAVTHVEADC
jgi:peptidoglycan/LPS O-acetylase OafA/YrhL